MLKTKKGITLIALVITIIIMLILVGVTAYVAIQGGLFSTARKAVTKTEEAKREEVAGRMQIGGVWYDSIDAYLNNEKSSNQTGITTKYEEPKDGEVLTENAIFTEGNQTAVIPKGFKIVNGIEGTQSIEQGLVIQDAEGNEFVWIPVDYEPTGKVDENGLDEGFKKVFYRSTWKDNARDEDLTSSKKYTEPYEEGYEGEKDEYYEMMRSVQTNKGFYIGRYEAGSVEKEDSSKGKPRSDTSNGTSGVVVKKDQYPYNYVGWGTAMNNVEEEITYYSKKQGYGAVKLSKDLYANTDNVGVVSTLCYGVQWDAMLDFIKDEKNLAYSRYWGNYQDNGWTIRNAKASYFSDDRWHVIYTMDKSTSQGVLLTTGASNEFAAKNIYDIAGNCWEWTMEASSTTGRVQRSRPLFRQRLWLFARRPRLVRSSR